MTISGEANTSWTVDKKELDHSTKQYRDETEIVTGHEEYFKTKYYLVGSASGKVRSSVAYDDLRKKLMTESLLSKSNKLTSASASR